MVSATPFRRRTCLTACFLILYEMLGHQHCNATEDLVSFLLVNRSDVWIVNMETSERKSLVGGLWNAIGVDYLYSKDLVFWTDVVIEQIQSVNVATGKSNSSVITKGLNTPDGIAVDWIYENVYWTDTGTNKIEVCDLQGTLRKTLFDKDLEEPRPIALDPNEGWMFWADWGEHAKIERAGMDGSRRSTIITENVWWPNGLTIDLVDRKVFWIDARLAVLCSADYNGNNIKVVYRDSQVIRHPFAVDVFGDFAYWTDWSWSSINKINKYTGKNVSTLASGFSSPMDLHVYHPQKQPSGENHCKISGQCSHLCLPAPRVTPNSTKFTCACPDKMVLAADGLNCFYGFSLPNTTSTTTISSSGTSSTTATSSTSSTSSSESTSTTTISSSGTSSTTATSSTSSTSSSGSTSTGTISSTSSSSSSRLSERGEQSGCNCSVCRAMTVQHEDQASTKDTSTDAGTVIGVLGGLAILITLLVFCAYKLYKKRNPARINFDKLVSSSTTENQFSSTRNQSKSTRSYSHSFEPLSQTGTNEFV